MAATSRTPLRLISLFTGAGGLDLGFEAAGFRTAAAVEMDRDCVATIRHNRDWPVIDRSIHEVASDELLRTAKLRVGEADLLIGGPPCQPFSKAGYWRNGDSLRLEDPRAATLEAYLRVLRDVQPRAFVLENVKGLAFGGKDEGLQLLLDSAQDINRVCETNYRLSWKVLQTAAYGVPQLRERVFVVGHRDGLDFEFPRPRFADPAKIDVEDGASLLQPYRTSWDALGGLPEPTGDYALRGKWGDLLPSIPEGENYLWHTDRKNGRNLFGWRTRYWSFLLKLAKNRPAWTISAQPGPSIGPFHWKSRRLTAREMCRLQTIPDDYDISGSLSAVQRQLGNAVPALMAEILALEIRRQLLGRPTRRSEFRLAMPRRAGMPPPERRRPVPRKYQILEGDHPDHPGPGLGRGAREAQG